MGVRVCCRLPPWLSPSRMTLVRQQESCDNSCCCSASKRCPHFLFFNARSAGNDRCILLEPRRACPRTRRIPSLSFDQACRILVRPYHALVTTRNIHKSDGFDLPSRIMQQISGAGETYLPNRINFPPRSRCCAPRTYLQSSPVVVAPVPRQHVVLGPRPARG